MLRPEGIDRELLVWTRADLHTKTLKGTMGAGPKWSQVVQRLIFERNTGELILDEEARNITRMQESAPAGNGYYDAATMLSYRKL